MVAAYEDLIAGLLRVLGPEHPRLGPGVHGCGSAKAWR